MLNLIHNPITHRLNRRHRWPSLRQTFWLGFGFGLLNLAITTWALLNLHEALLRWLIFIGWGMLVIGPLLAAPIATMMTRRDLIGDQYELLFLTSLSDEKLVQGYIGAALYRLRLLIALGVGSIPMVTLTSIYLGLRYEAIYLSITGYYGSVQDVASTPTMPEIAWLGVLAIGFSLFVGTFNFVAAALGVVSALRWHGRIGSMVVPFVLNSFIVGMLIGGFHVMLLISVGNPYLLTFCQVIYFFICLYAVWVPIVGNVFQYAREPLY